MANDNYWGLSSEELEVLEPEEELRLIKKAQAGDKDAYGEIVQHNLKLVWSVAKVMGSSGVGVSPINFQHMLPGGFARQSVAVLQKQTV